MVHAVRIVLWIFSQDSKINFYLSRFISLLLQLCLFWFDCGMYVTALPIAFARERGNGIHVHDGSNSYGSGYQMELIVV